MVRGQMMDHLEQQGGVTFRFHPSLYWICCSFWYLSAYHYDYCCFCVLFERNVKV